MTIGVHVYVLEPSSTTTGLFSAVPFGVLSAAALPAIDPFGTEVPFSSETSLSMEMPAESYPRYSNLRSPVNRNSKIAFLSRVTL